MQQSQPNQAATNHATKYGRQLQKLGLQSRHGPAIGLVFGRGVAELPQRPSKRFLLAKVHEPDT